MSAEQLYRERLILDAETLLEVVIWKVPQPVPPSEHGLKYRLVLIHQRERVIGYDNERGKGDHRHYRDVEEAYRFHSIEQLLQDFRSDVEAYLGRKL